MFEEELQGVGKDVRPNNTVKKDSACGILFFAWAGGDYFSGVGHKTFDNPKAFLTFVGANF